MAERQLKIVVRTEIRKGFADLNKQMQQLSSSIQKLSGLSQSIDRLAGSFDKVGAKTNAVASAARSLNKEAAAGARIAQGQASAQDKLIRQVGQLKSAEKSAAITKQTALQTEIKLINEVIRKTGDLSILEKRRDAKGRFGYGGLSADAVKYVKANYQPAQAAANFREGTKAYGPSTSLYNREQRGWNTIDAQLARRNSRFTFTPTNANNVYSQDSGQSSRIRNSMSRMTRGDSANTEYYRNLQIQQDREEKIAAREAARLNRVMSGGGGGRGPGGSYGGLPSHKDVEVSDKLYKNYTKLGHALFLLQQTTLTIFAASGISQIIEQADAYITLRNQVARTSDTIKDLGANMGAVFGIANKTFTDVKSVGTLFSTINKYSKDLGINKEQVAGVTGAISAAYAASPGTADSKSAAQYQLIQAISSNRLGGDELRSQLEQAPVIAEILGKGVAKLRGKTGTIDLRDKDNPVRTKELISVFGDPEVQKNLNKLMAEQSRTFSDVLMVAKNRVVEYMGKIQESSGFFTTLNKNMATFIAGDGFDKLMKGLGDAAVGLAVFASTLIATSAMKAGGSAIEGAIGQVGAVKNFSRARGAYKAAVSNARLTPRDLASGLINTEQAMARGQTVGLAADGLAASRNALAGPLKFVAELFLNVGTKINKFSLILKLLGGVFGIVVVAIGILAARFNHLLGVFGGGINIFDIVVGYWTKLVRIFEPLAKFFKPIVDGFFDLIDGPLKLLVKFFAGDKDIQDAKNRRLARAKASADGLPTGQKAELPGPTDKEDKKAKQMAERWREFIRDMKATTSATQFDMQVDDANLPDNVSSMFESYMGNVKKAVDILNIVTKGKTIGEIISAITSAKGGEFKNLNVNDFEVNLERAYTAQIKGYSKMIVDAAYAASSDNNINKSGLVRRQRARQSNYAQATDAFIDTINVDQAKAALARLIGSDKVDGMGEKEVRASLKGQVTASNRTGSNKAGFDFLAGKLDTDASVQLKDYFDLLEKKATDDEATITSWKDGIMNAVADYYNKITDSASIWGGVVTNALQSLEDVLTNYLTDPSFSEGKSGTEVAKEFGRGVLKDVGRAFVQQRIMKPILDMFGLGSKELGASATKPMWVRNVDQALGGVAEKGKNIFSNITDLFKKNEDGSGGFFSNVKNLFSKNEDGSGGGFMGALGKLFGGGSSANAGGQGSGIGGLLKKGVGFVSDLFGGGKSGGASAGGSGWLSTATSWLSSLFHEGGTAGSATMSRGVHPGVFRNAKYYHTGGVAGLPSLGSNEVPAILTRGEKIMTLAQQNAERSNATVNSPVYSPNIEINYTAGEGSTSSEADAQFMAQQFKDASQAQFQQFLLKEMKQGGMLSK